MTNAIIFELQTNRDELEFVLDNARECDDINEVAEVIAEHYMDNASGKQLDELENVNWLLVATEILEDY